MRACIQHQGRKGSRRTGNPLRKFLSARRQLLGKNRPPAPLYRSLVPEHAHSGSGGGPTGQPPDRHEPRTASAPVVDRVHCPAKKRFVDTVRCPRNPGRGGPRRAYSLRVLGEGQGSWPSRQLCCWSSKTACECQLRRLQLPGVSVTDSKGRLGSAGPSQRSLMPASSFDHASQVLAETGRGAARLLRPTQFTRVAAARRTRSRGATSAVNSPVLWSGQARDFGCAADLCESIQRHSSRSARDVIDGWSNVPIQLEARHARKKAERASAARSLTGRRQASSETLAIAH